MTKILTPEAFVHHIKGRLLEEGEIQRHQLWHGR